MFISVVNVIVYSRASSQNCFLLSGFCLWKHDIEVRYKIAAFVVCSRNVKCISLLKLSTGAQIFSLNSTALFLLGQLAMPPVN